MTLAAQADIPRPWRSACACGKLCYPSKAEAQSAITDMRSWPRKRPAPLNVYHCGVADVWHVGHRGRGRQ